MNILIHFKAFYKNNIVIKMCLKNLISLRSLPIQIIYEVTAVRTNSNACEKQLV